MSVCAGDELASEHGAYYNCEGDCSEDHNYHDVHECGIEYEANYGDEVDADSHHEGDHQLDHGGGAESHDPVSEDSDNYNYDVEEDCAEDNNYCERCGEEFPADNWEDHDNYGEDCAEDDNWDEEENYEEEDYEDGDWDGLD